MNSPRKISNMTMQRQRGAAFIVMLVILVMGVTIFFVGALSKVTLQTARNEKSSDLLAQAKEVVIGYAVNGTGGGQQPGDILRPDTFASTESPPNYDGSAETGCLDFTQPSGLPLTTNVTNMRCLGRLPWEDYVLSIGYPSENDPTGFMPWYALSVNLVDPSGVTFNSELLNTDNTLHPPNNFPPPPHPWLTVHDMNGNVLSDRVAFIIFIPGPPLPGQSRPTSPNLDGANQYLDSITVSATCTAPCKPGVYNNAAMNNDFIMGDDHRWIVDPVNPSQQIEDPNYHFNDKLLYVTIDELMPLIEKRIGREVKTCLDDYAAMPVPTNSNLPGWKYPWAAPVTDNTYTGTINTLFGRVSSVLNTSPSGSGSAAATTLNSVLTALQTALDNYFAAGNSSNRTTLINAGNNVISLQNSVAGVSSSTIYTAGDWGVEFAGGQHTYSSVSGKISTALNAVGPLVSNPNPNPDTSMSTTWPASCSTLFASTYWPNWQRLVFYQIADGYKPGTVTPICNTSCLTIYGSANPDASNPLINGTYRAAIIVAGKYLGAQTRPSYTTPPTDYLANPNALLEKSSDTAFVTNAHDNTALTTRFITYKTSDPYYQNVNDLVLCLDGKNNCK